jgi:hypothetical protein
MDIITYGLLNKRIVALEEKGGSLPIHICTSDEYNHTTGVPTISSPDEGTLYLVPASSATTGNLFDEWVYVDSAWEKVGSVNVDIPVQDIQVAGVSVLDAQGVANVPMASPNVPGVILSGTIAVTGTTPAITALSGIRYVCGEVSTITITPPSSGIANIVFESGMTPTVLTLPQTVVMPEWFDSTDLEANRVYEISIADGVYGVVTSWPA